MQASWFEFCRLIIWNFDVPKAKLVNWNYKKNCHFFLKFSAKENTGKKRALSTCFVIHRCQGINHHKPQTKQLLSDDILEI